MTKVQVDDTFSLRNSTYVYKVFDIIGDKKSVPTEDRIIYLRINSKIGWFQSGQAIISIPERSMELFFIPTVSK